MWLALSLAGPVIVAQPIANLAFLEEEPQAIRIRASTVAPTEEAATRIAEEQVFRAILFRGIPGATPKYNKPLVGTDEAGILEQHRAFMETFFEGKRYKSFIESTIITAGPIRVENQTRSKKDDPVSLTVDIRVLVASLRADLEKNGLIRKFGY